MKGLRHDTNLASLMVPEGHFMGAKSKDWINNNSGGNVIVI